MDGEPLDSVCRAVLRQVESLGYVVTVDVTDTCVSVQAIGDDGQVYRASADEPLPAVCALAQAVGIDVEE